MTEVLTGVVSTETVKVCPREHLGLTCASPLYDCLCKDVGTSTMEVQQDTSGPVAVLTMYLKPGVTDWSRVRKGIQLSGNYRTDWAVRMPTGLELGMTVEARWDLWRPENKSLQQLLAASWNKSDYRV